MIGGQVLVILGEHVAAQPQAAAAALAHEAGHYEILWLRAVHHSRNTAGWGWAAAGLAGALIGGWPAAAIAVALFWAGSLLALWTGEIGCDLRSVRTEGYRAALAGFAYMASLPSGGVRAQVGVASAARPWRRRAQAVAVNGLAWAAGPAHPPLRLRRALVRVLAGQARAGKQEKQIGELTEASPS